MVVVVVVVVAFIYLSPFNTFGHCFCLVFPVRLFLNKGNSSAKTIWNYDLFLEGAGKESVF